MKHDKSDIFHSSRGNSNFNPELDFLAIGAPILKPKTYWGYFGFYFDHSLSFKKHICYYSTKALSTVKVMSMLENLTRDLLPLQKWLLYCFYVILIANYGFKLWFFARSSTKA